MGIRSDIDNQEFDLLFLHKMMRQLFPKKNDCAATVDLEEVRTELQKFNIVTKKQVRLFLKKYRRQLLDIDREPLDLWHRKMYREDLGETIFNDKIRRQFWFCYPALIRTAMEIEFGEGYEDFANKRDALY